MNYNVEVLAYVYHVKAMLGMNASVSNIFGLDSDWSSSHHGSNSKKGKSGGNELLGTAGEVSSLVLGIDWVGSSGIHLGGDDVFRGGWNIADGNVWSSDCCELSTSLIFAYKSLGSNTTALSVITAVSSCDAWLEGKGGISGSDQSEGGQFHF